MLWVGTTRRLRTTETEVLDGSRTDEEGVGEVGVPMSSEEDPSDEDWTGEVETKPVIGLSTWHREETSRGVERPGWRVEVRRGDGLRGPTKTRDCGVSSQGAGETQSELTGETRSESCSRMSCDS